MMGFVHMGVGISNCLAITIGVKQEYTLSPTLFGLCSDELEKIGQQLYKAIRIHWRSYH